MNEPIRSPLSPNMMMLLRLTVERHVPELFPLVDTVGKTPLNETDREALRGVVLTEFLAAGLGSDDEPTPYGLELEELIDALGRC
jgi:hypothetical protein